MVSAEYEKQFEPLVKDVLKLLKEASTYRIVLIVVGGPGSGKSTLAAYLERKLNELKVEQYGAAAAIPKYVEFHKSAQKSFLDEQKDRIFPLPVNPDQAATLAREDIDNENYEAIYYKDSNHLCAIGRGGIKNCITSTNEQLDIVENAHHKLAQRVTMDGFHLPKSVLAKLKDPVNAIKRRGAPFTFDSCLAVSLAEQIVDGCKAMPLTEAGKKLNKEKLFMLKDSPLSSISVPDFSHGAGDPYPNGALILPTTRIVIYEGNYLMMDQGLWSTIPKLVEESPGVAHAWAIKVDDADALRKRVTMRHFSAGIVKSIAEGALKYDNNDKLNSEFISKHTVTKDIEKVVHN